MLLTKEWKDRLDSQVSSSIRCPKCNGLLEMSGVEAHRYICKDCSQNYHGVLQFVPVDPIKRTEIILGSDNAGGSSTPGNSG